MEWVWLVDTESMVPSLGQRPVWYHDMKKNKSMVWYDMKWYGMAWFGMVWYGVVDTDKLRQPTLPLPH